MKLKNGNETIAMANFPNGISKKYALGDVKGIIVTLNFQYANTIRYIHSLLKQLARFRQLTTQKIDLKFIFSLNIICLIDAKVHNRKTTF